MPHLTASDREIIGVWLIELGEELRRPDPALARRPGEDGRIQEPRETMALLRSVRDAKRCDLLNRLLLDSK